MVWPEENKIRQMPIGMLVPHYVKLCFSPIILILEIHESIVTKTSKITISDSTI